MKRFEDLHHKISVGYYIVDRQLKIMITNLYPQIFTGFYLEIYYFLKKHFAISVLIMNNPEILRQQSF